MFLFLHYFLPVPFPPLPSSPPHISDGEKGPWWLGMSRWISSTSELFRRLEKREISDGEKVPLVTCTSEHISHAMFSSLHFALSLVCQRNERVLRIERDRVSFHLTHCEEVPTSSLHIFRTLVFSNWREISSLQSTSFLDTQTTKRAWRTFQVWNIAWRCWPL